MKISYNWLQSYFAEPLPSVEGLEQVFMMRAFEVDGVEKVGDDYVIDIDVLPNRAHDALGHRGVAKELSVLLGREMKKDELSGRTAKLEPVSQELSVALQDEEWCPRYTGALIKGVKVGESPAWLREKLEALGQKSINNVVDITNYVMFGIGQPTHIFDADKLTNNDGIKIGVRAARDGESVTILGGEEHELESSMAVITDAHTDSPIAIAGIKGGASAEVDESTVNIVVESAKFQPIKTRRASAALKLRTDAVQRFENEVAIQQPPFGAREVARLITELAGGTIEGYVDTNRAADDMKIPSVTVTLTEVNEYLGSCISSDEVADILRRFGWEHTIDGDTITATPPFERLDVRLREDIYEEIGRVHGFGSIEGEPLPGPAPQQFINKTYAYSEHVRKALSALGVTEVFGYTLCNKGEIKLASTLSADKDHIRDNLTDGMVGTLDRAQTDAPLLGQHEQVSAYEIGKVFTKELEYTSVAVGVRALSKKKQEQKQDDFIAQVQGALESALGASLAGVKQGAGILEFSLTETIKDLPTPERYPELPLIAQRVIYQAQSAYPFILRDIAVWVPEQIDEQVITDIIAAHGGTLVQRIDKFDEFTKDGRVSLAFRIVFQAMDRTLTDQELSVIMEQVEHELAAKGCEVR